MMKQSAELKLDHDTSTSVALILRRPWTHNNRFAVNSLVTTWLKPEATPPAFRQIEVDKTQAQITFTLCEVWVFFYIAGLTCPS